MDDLISRGEAKRKLAYVLKSYGMEHVKNRISDALNRCKAVDAASVVQGRWKYFHKKNKAVCTHCSFERDLDLNFGKAISCPNCGARMDLSEGEEN